MKIVRLDVENIKRVVAVTITPEGNLVEITGRNGNGKTSVLNAIWWALGGKEGVQQQPIRKGAEEGRVELDLGPYIVTRIFNRPKEGGEYTTRLEVRRPDGTPIKQPQTTLDSFLGELTFDPLAFLRMDPETRFELMQSFVPEVDFAAIEQAYKADYEKRTEINRRAKEAKTLAQTITADMSITGERIDTTQLVDDLERAGLHNQEITERKGRREQAAQTIEAKRGQARSLRSRAESLREEAGRLDAQADTIVAETQGLQSRLDSAEPLPDLVDTAALRQSISDANVVNAKIDARDRRLEKLREAKRYEDESAALTARMEARQRDAVKKIAAAKIPVPGISFGDIGARTLMLDGMPFEQASDAQQLRASIDMAIAKNPKLKVILVRDGSLLDSQSLAVVAERAEAADVQVWMERVTEGGPGGFVIEDGGLKSAPETAPKRKASNAKV